MCRLLDDALAPASLLHRAVDEVSGRMSYRPLGGEKQVGEVSRRNSSEFGLGSRQRRSKLLAHSSIMLPRCDR
jgi:hypothetical protein